MAEATAELTKSLPHTQIEPLLFSAEDTQRRINELRDFVATDVEVQAEREKFIQSSPEVVIMEDGTQYIRLYRGIKKDWDKATVASGFSSRGDSRYKREKLEGIEDVLSQHKLGQVSGLDVVNRMVGGHIASSRDSVMVPATVSLEYAEFFYEDVVLVLKVPIEYTIPVTHFVKKFHFANETFWREQEVAVVGRIEPEWIESVQTSQWP